ncbi:unnamed protein product [Acanthoscelides obtectus]|uniref:Retrotransposon gag domain-containing protein n=1 Tax=Acanthoscelides obtectus TaxID=200917 RepID=A0A9P0JUW6_ACAOB|nr:unnamed protein product [Acanthoscelides obtectus]CAK1641121.1 hypothetical protein AOBTE_LOCUS12170 [Acanthoscelides obtectus]
MYISRFDQYFIASKIEEELEINTLLAVVGKEMSELIIDLCNKPEEITYEAMIRLVINHLQPEPSKRAERFKLRLRKQERGESLAQYLDALKKLAKTCQFGEFGRPFN